MFTEGRSDDYTPLTVIGRFPIYWTELLIILHVASMVIWAILGGSTGWVYALAYEPGLIIHKLQLWRLASYIFLNQPSLWFAVGMLMLWWFGREVERFYGSRNFLISYAALTLIPAIVALIPVLNVPLIGPTDVHFGVFLMFAVTYPGVAFFFAITAKWLAWIYLAIYSLIYLAQRNVAAFVQLWLAAGIAFAMTRFWGRGDWLPESWNIRMPSFRRKPKFTVVNKPSASVSSSATVRRKSSPTSSGSTSLSDDPVSSIDPILDKIAKRGINSLTPRERAALERASGALQRKESGK